MKTILVTGGAGYIGSHTVRALAEQGWEPLTLDNLSTGHAEAVLEGELVEGHLQDEALLHELFSRRRIEGVLHFASLCYVGESMRDPRRYFEENLGNALTLLRVMLEHGVRRLVLSSTCAVYGVPQTIPIDESHPRQPVNPYGESKEFIERILERYDQSYGLRSVRLRYFNAAGASRDGRLGESHDPETHLIPRVLKCARGELEEFSIYGEDYPTSDGTCVRDYIHVEDLAQAHLLALRWLEEEGKSRAFNLGSGSGYSVREVVATAERITGKKIPTRTSPRRPGDPPRLVADPRRARRELGWEAHASDLGTILSSAWAWEQDRRY